VPQLLSGHKFVPLFLQMVVACVLLDTWGAATTAAPSLNQLEAEFTSRTHALLASFCVECHSTEAREGELDLERFTTFRQVRDEPAVWQHVAAMLDSGEMPPEGARQPSSEQRQELRDWVRRYLHAEARARAGDPGPVVLRRLNNAQYTYTLRDLTGIASLQPAHEFAVDSGAGEGFTNTGSALVMSPALLAKYVDAAKDVAAHAVLVPDGIRFSSATTRRDWTNERLDQIRQFYRRYTDPMESSQVRLQGLVWESADGGRIPLARYLEATLAERDSLQTGSTTIEHIAQQRGLSSKYLGLLWRALSDNHPSPLLDSLRARWRNIGPQDVAALVTEIAHWQERLWRFQPVGHIGKVGGPTAWQEPISPLVNRQEIRLPLPQADSNGVVTLYLAVADAGDGREGDQVVWHEPRFVAPGRPDILLRDVRELTGQLANLRRQLFGTARKCLTAAGTVLESDHSVDVAALAQAHQVDADVLQIWLEYLGLQTGQPARIEGYLTVPIRQAAGYDFIQGWGSGGDTPNLVVNSSDQPVRIPGNMPPHSVAVHPSPQLRTAVGWRCPRSVTVRVDGLVQPAHPECGNGVTWALESRRGTRRQRLAAGVAQGGQPIQVGPLEKLHVRTGDLLSLLIGPRDGNHACDLTRVDLQLADVDDPSVKWQLAQEVSAGVLHGNPLADGLGNAEVWHFYTEADGESNAEESIVPPESLLSHWQAADTAAQRATLAAALHDLLAIGRPATDQSPDAQLYRQLAALQGPLLTSARKRAAREGRAMMIGSSIAATSEQDRWGLEAARFGIDAAGAPLDPASFVVQAPVVLEIRLPGDLLVGTEFRSEVTLAPATTDQGSVQVVAATTHPKLPTALHPDWPILVHDRGAARQRIDAALHEFRELFPAALCYTRIVPVDEVVTLTLFYREDDALRRLMLDPQQTAELDRLWHELRYVSRDALTLVDAFEQLWQYATQDADPSAFEPLRQPILDRAAAFRQELIDTEPAHVEAVVRWAAQAYRRELDESEAQSLRDLYRTLRSEDLAHEDAVRLLLTRVLVSPAFLYRTERRVPSQTAGSSTEATTSLVPSHPVSDEELATRLSYFLWSSLPDAALRDAAASGRLHEPEQLVAQSRRMLADERTRRLATEFACQWLQIYEFDTHDEKSEAVFPTFAELRGAMYEEPIRFFGDWFQRNGSVLEILDADHTFVNTALAQHYGLSKDGGDDWQRVEGLKQQGRGGILGMASILAKQSGASRTSPILRGNWVCEVLLGDRLPRPPKDVPLLPDVVPAGLTERQLIEQHSSVASCAKCHVRIDPYGFSLEAFDAIGRDRRHADGAPAIDTRTVVEDGTPIDGLEGLRSYLLTARRDDFVRQFCRKLLGYALGRSVQLSDEPLLESMQANLKANDYRIHSAVQTLVLSKQFTHVRAAAGDTEAITP
jgi:hypothetical protein